jgi:hypothetical protein
LPARPLPYYGIRIDLDPKEIAAFLLEMRIAPPPAAVGRRW